MVLLVGLQSMTCAALAKPSGEAVPVKPSASAAAPAAQAAADEASQRFQRGVTLFHEHSVDAALAEFNRAYELAPDHRVLYNIAQVQAERGDFVAAVKYLRKYLAEGGNAVNETRTAEVRAEIARLELRTAKLRVVGNVDGAELLVDGEPMGVLPLASVPINAGTRQITVRKKGFEPQELRLMLTGGEDKSVQVTLRTESGATPIATAQAANSAPPRSAASLNANESSTNTGFWISLAVTGVAGGAAAVFGVLTTKADDRLGDELNRYPASQQTIDDSRSELKRNALLTDGCAALAVVGLGATIYFAATGGEKKAPEQRRAAQTASIRTMPFSLGSHAAGWQLTGRF